MSVEGFASAAIKDLQEDEETATPLDVVLSDKTEKVSCWTPLSKKPLFKKEQTKRSASNLGQTKF